MMMVYHIWDHSRFGLYRPC